jgi:hypothetical protein
VTSAGSTRTTPPSDMPRLAVPAAAVPFAAPVATLTYRRAGPETEY